MRLGPEYTLADLPNDSIINPSKWRSASCVALRQLDAVHHKDGRLALGTFTICRTENFLCQAGLAKLDEKSGS
jgi:hypothetical protein